MTLRSHRNTSPTLAHHATAPSLFKMILHVLFTLLLLSSHPTNVAAQIPRVCAAPKLTGDWQKPQGTFPIPVVEGQGGIMGKYFCMVSGFYGGANDTTPKIHCIDTQNTKANWVQKVSLKDSDSIEGTKLGTGLSHGANAIVGSKFYLCGGFLGANPGPAIKDCWYYNNANNTISAITSLPQPRGGGAMMYSPVQNSLIFTAGAVRPVLGESHSIDYVDTWTYNLTQGDRGEWVSQDDAPFTGNHIMYTRAYDENNLERFYLMGGQVGENERYANIDTMYEFVPSKPKGSNEQWIKRPNMLIKRGHANSSTRSYGCGLIIIGGTTNRPTGKIDTIHYYDIPTNAWSEIGHLGEFVNTPVCDIYTDPVGQDWVWCTSPRKVYRKQKISL